LYEYNTSQRNFVETETHVHLIARWMAWLMGHDEANGAELRQKIMVEIKVVVPGCRPVEEGLD